MKRTFKIFSIGCGIFLFFILVVLGKFTYSLYQESKPEEKFFRVFYTHPPNYVSELKIKEYYSFNDDQSIFKFKCNPEHFKELKMIRWKKESGDNQLCNQKAHRKWLTEAIKEFNLNPSMTTEYEQFQSAKNPMITCLGYDKDNELVFGMAMSYWDKVPDPKK